MKKIILAIVSLVFILSVNANEQIYEKTTLGVKSTINTVNVEIQFWTRKTLRRKHYQQVLTGIQGIKCFTHVRQRHDSGNQRPAVYPLIFH